MKYIFTQITVGEETGKYDFDGTPEEALAYFRELVARTFSPFVWWRYTPAQQANGADAETKAFAGKTGY